MADFAFIDKKVVGGVGGEGVLIERINIKQDINRTTKEKVVYLEIGGTAHTVLNDNYDPTAGYKELPEPLPVTARIDLKKAATADNQNTFDDVSRAFRLSKPLTDGKDQIRRFMKGAKDSVYDEIIGQPCFFRMKLATGKTGDRPSDFYGNFQPMAVRTEATVEEWDRIVAELEAAEAAGAGNPF